MSKLSLRVAKEKADSFSWFGRLIALTPLVLSTVNLTIAITLPIFHYDRFLERAMREIEGRGILRKWLDNFSGFFWQQVTPDQVAQNEIWWHQTWAAIYLIISLVLCWLVWRWAPLTSPHFMGGKRGVVFGVIYSLLPVDIFPDFIPAAGSFDDAIALLVTDYTFLNGRGRL